MWPKNGSAPKRPAPAPAAATATATAPGAAAPPAAAPAPAAAAGVVVVTVVVVQVGVVVITGRQDGCAPERAPLRGAAPRDLDLRHPQGGRERRVS